MTVCARKGAADLSSSSLATDLLAHLRQHVAAERFALLAYCFMPNHVHLALEGLSEASDLRRLVSQWKQATGYRYKQEHRQGLWMPGYHDRVLRDGEPTMNVVLYALRNPVRAGLAGSLCEYPFAGSDVFGDEELREILGAGQKACCDR